jgi:hypothetical protein
MKQLVSKDGIILGVSSNFTLDGDKWVGDNCIYYISVAGEGCAVADYTPPTPIPEPPAPELRYITKLAFRNRFTAEEKVMIELAGAYNPADPIQKQQLAASVRVSNADIAASTYIDLDRPDTRAGVKSMEDFGLLAVRRADEILDNPVQDFERYKG